MGGVWTRVAVIGGTSTGPVWVPTTSMVGCSTSIGDGASTIDGGKSHMLVSLFSLCDGEDSWLSAATSTVVAELLQLES